MPVFLLQTRHRLDIFCFLTLALLFFAPTGGSRVPRGGETSPPRDDRWREDWGMGCKETAEMTTDTCFKIHSMKKLRTMKWLQKQNCISLLWAGFAMCPGIIPPHYEPFKIISPRVYLFFIRTGLTWMRVPLGEMTFLCPLLDRRSLAVSDKSDAMKSLWVKLLLDGIRPEKPIEGIPEIGKCGRRA